jgi:hypothetical protein
MITEEDTFRRLRRVPFDDAKEIMCGLDDLEERKERFSQLGWTELEYINEFIKKWDNEAKNGNRGRHFQKTKANTI